MKKKNTVVLSAFLALSMGIVGCSKPADTTQTKPTEPSQAATTEQQPKDGGKIVYAYESPFQGLLDRGFYEGDDDDRILRFMMDSLLDTGDDLKTYSKIASWKESPDHLTYTFTLKKGVKWHNGDELTVEDWLYAFEVIGHKDYKGSRYSNVKMIAGMDEYNKGVAKTISGVKIIDPYNIEIKIKKPMVNFLDNIWSNPMPKKYYAGISVKDLPNSPKVRQQPIGLGPFKVKKIQPGEFVELERFDDYWQGKPHLDGVIYKVIDGKLANSLLKKGEVDIMAIPRSQVKEIEKNDNLILKEVDELAYSYIGFKLGHWDENKKVNVMDNPKFADKRLRQAMAYALDRKALADAFENGKAVPLNSPMPPVSWAKVPADQINAYEYNPEKAKQLLDEAGYKDINGDGFREDPQGKKFTINYDAMTRDETAEPRAQAVMQFWKEVGLDAKLNGGALKEFNLFYRTVEKDEPSVEVFAGAWALANDPDPTGLWKIDAFWNFPRWVNAESDKLIEEGISEKAFDENYRKEVYFKWQKLVNEEVPMIILHARKDITAYNKRLQGVHTNSFTNQIDTHKWWVTN
ncbi:oligopeptide ABC transporter substrate-binding protein [Brevibacillus laterosporus]|uniref:Oligopeptide ABC transporter substrate-binding protein n=1 Tax=Brevibacillus laterosporus TaxID=1465 RepID=A0AAP3DH35_BRELA|nr:oligopeptide ABC transporter substrate-binding protein [Brevibacillus laterosporus]MCR8979835.1 oligopeptide ABC transporter substrate-binding protein [Brevibacillus laterosporus]MCZ0806990.1 oligopeptide ABC transporter substrate-binding protein [Brevibacillus laterosporus]MCZ0827951.1 oligopeptide ABC transporter substrate-binding protein [Brevibacillus laterosporus]MCZ0851948.1 oligopeptide ABC transporter substrate-binding protein [Brevibacillus laterosporus]MED1664961.1 oligopeptide AB